MTYKYFKVIVNILVIYTTPKSKRVNVITKYIFLINYSVFDKVRQAFEPKKIVLEFGSKYYRGTRS